MHGGHLVKEFRLDQLQAGLEQFGANNHGHAAAQQEHGEAEPQIHRADVLVVGSQYPAHQAFGRTMGMVVVMVINHCTHDGLLIGCS